MKLLKYVITTVFVIALIAFLVLYLSVNTIVKNGIEEVGTEMTGTAVTVDRVSISPFSGRGKITGFRVANPEGFSRDYAIIIEDFSIELDLFTLFSDEVVAREIIITSPFIYVEQRLPENNLNTLLQHIRSVAPEETTDKDLVIDHFIMTNAIAEFYTEIGGEREERIEMTDIELHDIGRGGERAAAEAVIQRITERLVEQALDAAVQRGGEQLRDAIRDIFE